METPTMVHPSTGEILFAPRPGVTIYSRTRKWNDDSDHQSPVGGHIIDIDSRRIVHARTDEWEPLYTIVAYKWGRVHYDKIPESDVDWTQYNGGIHTPAIRQLATKLNTADGDHLHALLVLTNAMANQ